MAQRVEAQRAQREMLNSIKEAKEFDTVRCGTQKHDSEVHRKWKQVEHYKFWGMAPAETVPCIW